jgi:hypothetical protein
MSLSLVHTLSSENGAFIAEPRKEVGDRVRILVRSTILRIAKHFRNTSDWMILDSIQLFEMLVIMLVVVIICELELLLTNLS